MNAETFLITNSLSLSASLTSPKLPEFKCRRRFSFRFLWPEIHRPPSKFRNCVTAELRNISGKRRNFGKVWADVKPKPFEVSSDSAVTESVKLRDALNDAVLEEKWWEHFPRRWVIVILCFSAFLLCNMDRVSSNLSPYFSTDYYFLYFFLFNFDYC
ncbi:hypothetical protein SOVF_046760 [Spinacia oleracea]|nr:hypothetical protein SOVF_046760 [Spinacia oleracea]